MSLREYSLIVPLTTDSLALLHTKPGLGVISLMEILMGYPCLAPLPVELDKSQLQSLKRFFHSNPNAHFSGLPAHYVSLREQIESIGMPIVRSYELEERIHCEQQHMFISYYQQAQELLKLQSSDVVIGCDHPAVLSYLQDTFQTYTSLWHTSLGAGLYYSGQFLTYQSKEFLLYIPGKFTSKQPFLLQPAHWKDLAYYTSEMNYDSCFEQHVRLLFPAWESDAAEFEQVESAIASFRTFIKHGKEYFHTYIKALSVFLRTQLQPQNNKPVIYPVSAIRFFPNVHVVAGLAEVDQYYHFTLEALQSCRVKHLIRSNNYCEQMCHFLPEAPDPVKVEEKVSAIKIKESKPLLSVYQYDLQQFLKVIEAAGTQEYEGDNMKTEMQVGLSIHKIFQSFLKLSYPYTSSPAFSTYVQEQLQNEDQYVKSIILYKWEKVLKNFLDFIESGEEGECDHPFPSAPLRCKVGRIYISGFLDALCYGASDGKKPLIIDVGSGSGKVLSTSLALKIYTFIKQNKLALEDVKAVLINVSGAFVFNNKQVEKKMQEIESLIEQAQESKLIPV